jgi:hypothetical protein
MAYPPDFFGAQAPVVAKDSSGTTHRNGQKKTAASQVERGGFYFRL